MSGMDSSFSARPPPQPVIAHWRKPFEMPISDMRVPSITIHLLVVILSLVLPMIEYWTVLRDAAPFISYPAALWAGTSLCAVTGVVAIATMRPSLMLVHAAICAAASAAMAAVYTGLYFQADFRCNVGQAAFSGCGTCLCATLNTCTQEDLQSDTCSGCSAWGTDTCRSLTKDGSFVSWCGLVMLPLLAVSAAASLFISARVIASREGLTQRLAAYVSLAESAHRELAAGGRLESLDAEDLFEALQVLISCGIREHRRAARETVVLAVQSGYRQLAGLLDRSTAEEAVEARQRHARKVAPEEGCRTEKGDVAVEIGAYDHAQQPASHQSHITTPALQQPMPSGAYVQPHDTRTAWQEEAATSGYGGAGVAGELPPADHGGDRNSERVKERKKKKDKDREADGQDGEAEKKKKKKKKKKEEGGSEDNVTARAKKTSDRALDDDGQGRKSRKERKEKREKKHRSRSAAEQEHY